MMSPTRVRVSTPSSTAKIAIAVKSSSTPSPAWQD
jgi:hypothetical protein